MQTQQKIFLVLSLISLLILIIISQNISPLQPKLANITEENLNQNIKIQVNIESIKNFENQSFQLLTLKDSTGTLTGTTNSRNPLKLDLSKNYTIFGKVSEYNNTIQISINKIELIK